MKVITSNFGSINIKRGLFRLWLIASVAWMVFAFIASDAKSKIEYTYQFYTKDSSSVDTEHNNIRTNPYLERMEREALAREAALKENANIAADALHLEIARQERVGKLLLNSSTDNYADAQRLARRNGVPLDTILKIPKEDALARDFPASDKKFTHADFKELAHKEPNWDWAILMLLPPTLGVAGVIFTLWVAFFVSRWVWRGFSA